MIVRIVRQGKTFSLWGEEEGKEDNAPELPI